MQKVFVLLAAMFLSFSAQAVEVGDCIYPKVKKVSKTKVDYKEPVTVYRTASDLYPIGNMSEVSAFYIYAVAGEYVAVALRIDERRFTGWVKMKQFELQSPYACYQ